MLYIGTPTSEARIKAVSYTHLDVYKRQSLLSREFTIIRKGIKDNKTDCKRWIDH